MLTQDYICPSCRGRLILKDEYDYICSKCRLYYKSKNGIPILIYNYKGEISFYSTSLVDTATISKVIFEKFIKRVILFYGVVGAGKTTFINQLLKNININNSSSPTFNIINEYEDGLGLKIYHCDFYRINSIVELENTGFLDYINSKDTFFIEWAENVDITDYINNPITATIEVLPNGDRVFNFKNI